MVAGVSQVTLEQEGNALSFPVDSLFQVGLCEAGGAPEAAPQKKEPSSATKPAQRRKQPTTEASPKKPRIQHAPMDKHKLEQLRYAIRSQFDYYFGDANYAKDNFLRSQADDDGWTSLRLVAKFNRVRELTEDFEAVQRSLEKLLVFVFFYLLLDNVLAEEDDDLNHSPTELAEDDEPNSPMEAEDDGNAPGAAGILVTAEEVKKEIEGDRVNKKKKKRERQGDNIRADDEPDLESPSKRPVGSGEAPISGKELREILQMHMYEMRNAWSEERARVDRLEAKTNKLGDDFSEAANEISGMKEDVSNLKGRPYHGRNLTISEDDGMTDEEKRTLILGGWPQDTKKAIIEAESKTFLEHPSMQGLVDVAQATVYGPRRSVGSLKFEYRDNEDYKAVRERMWNVVKAVRTRAEVFPSAKNQQNPRPAWAAFVKTPEARKRTGLVSQVRRVTIQLAIDCTDENGQPKHPESIVQDLFDCIVDKTAFKRKWRGYPIMLGVDANEQPTWNKENENEDDFNITNTSVNLEALLEEVYNLGLKAVTPIDSQLSTPTHYPRDPMRTGRQIDMLFTKSLMVSRSRIRPDMRHCIGTDHAEINCDIFSSGSRFQPWGSDTRPRKLSALLPHQHTIVDGDDLCHLAQTCTRPKCSPSYHDSDEIKQMIAKAKATNDPTLWKKVHKTRRRARNEWIKSRSSAVLQGDWGAFRSYQKDKRRRKGWWGRMLTDKSAAELTQEVQSHLEEKMTDPANSNWDEVVSGFIERLVLPEHWQPFTKEEIFETLSHMKPHAAVGEDIICVDLLKAIVLHDNLGEQFVALLNHIVHHNQQPESWGVSILALLAKCADPAAPGDLRPICVGSNFAKLTNRLVMARVFPVLRRGSRCSTCGKNRQVADLVGVMTRMRDMLHEWREPLLIAKLDVAGAFDRLSRPKVAELIIERTQHTNLGREVRYMLQQLGVNQLKGTVPGGHSINIKANVGIRQGAPESAELFGLVMGLMLDTMLDTKDWMAIGAPVQDLDIELLFFQDDIFVFETSTARLARKINLVGDVLHGGGLCLAMKKTKIVATADYKGKMVVEIAGQEVKIQKNESIKVLGVNFNFSAPAAQQAEELLGRARGAFEEHRHLLMAKGSWKSKAFTMAMLITSTWRWVAGAVHWSRESLCKANSLQAQILRTSFKMSRTSDENWVDWNKRLNGPPLLFRKDIPLPFETDTTMIDTGAQGDSGELCDESGSADCDANGHKPVEEEDWFEVVRDRRGLRGRAALPPRRPLHGRDPSTLTTPKTLSVEERIGDVGITQRGRKTRTGVDRWHYPNGTIRRRLREQHAEDAERPNNEGNEDTITFYDKKQWLEDRSDKHKPEAGGSESSTTGSDRGTLPTQSSSSSNTEAIGFWKAGIWIPRCRTPAEQRTHRGGNGPQRSQRKAARVDSYFAGTWKPAWLTNYAQAKREREAQAGHEIQETQLATPPSMAQATDVDPWSGQNQDNQWWAGWYDTSSSSWTSWTWSSTTSTSLPEAAQEVVPNLGLFPNVINASAPSGVTVSTEPTMELTNSERAHLEDAGVPRSEIQRLAHLFASLDEHERMGTGPESRWALGRLSQRGDEGVQCLESLLLMIQRRLRPRGHWPVTRIPRPQHTQLRMFTWVGQFGSILSNSLEHQLRTPLQPSEEGGRTVDSDSDVVPMEQTTNATTAHEEVNRDFEHEPDPDAASSSATRSRSSSRVLDTMTPITTAEAQALQGVPGLAAALNGELLGIWSEDTTTTTSTTMSSVLGNDPLLSTSTGEESADLWSDNSEMPHLFRDGPSCTSTSTTSTTTRPTTLDAIRDAVIRNLALANPADVIDVLHRLLADMRDLVRRQRLFIEALEEVVRRLPRPPNPQVFNGRAIAHTVADRVLEEAGYGDGVSLGMQSQPVDAPAILLQPGLPQTVDEANRALPNIGRGAVAGLRRRAWRQHMRNLYEQEGETLPASPSDYGNELVVETFTDLFFVQGTSNTMLVAPGGCPPYPVLPEADRPSHRRRLHQPRPRAQLAERDLRRPHGSRRRQISSEGAARESNEAATRESVGRSGRPSVRNRRERSRSRDVSLL
ncbi:pol [Symbiodinium sp. KB8]|nr:pol [Symbiodinium sp. KB8]